MLTNTTSVLEYLEYFITSQKRLVDLPNGITRSTLRTYVPRRKHMINFFSKNNMSNFRPDQIKIQHIREFKLYLISDCKHGNNYTMKCLQLLDRILDIALENEHINVNPMNLFKYNYDRDVRIEALEGEDVIKIRKLILRKPLEITRDLFLFSCYTGLAYIDAQNFDFNNNIITGPDQRKWIHIQRQKSSSDTYLPLLLEAEDILRKYDYKIPKKSNSKMNKGLKIIGRLAGIKTILKSHIARKTFGTILHNDLGVPLESVSKMLGHKSIKTTEKSYVKTNLKRIAADMEGISFSTTAA